MSDLKHSEISKFLQKEWKLDDKAIVAHHDEFMKAINGVLFWLISESGESKNPIESAYDSTMILSDIQKAIEEYREMYHIVSCTFDWKGADDE